MKVDNRPICADGFIWWRVRGNGKIGWVAESEPGNYFIEPLQ
jgi:hypothetical protein